MRLFTSPRFVTALTAFFLMSPLVLLASVTNPVSQNCISADNAANATNPAFTLIAPLEIREQSTSDFVTTAGKPKTLLLSISNGWIFKAGSGKFLSKGRDLRILSMEVTEALVTIRMSISGFNSLDVLTIAGLEVQSTDGARLNEPAFIFRSAENPGTAQIQGMELVSTGSVTNAGSLAVLIQEPGLACKLAFQQKPSPANTGVVFPEQPVVISQDQFGNESNVGLGEKALVRIKLSSGTGQLDGNTVLDLGTAAGNGMAIFTDLRITEAGEKKLIATTSAIGFAVSNLFTITDEEETTNYFANDPDLVCKL